MTSRRRNIKGPSELKLSLTVSPSLLTSELKAKINEQTQIEPERQRLIYSGKVRRPCHESDQDVRS